MNHVWVTYQTPSCVRLLLVQIKQGKLLFDCHRATDNWEKQIISDIQEDDFINYLQLRKPIRYSTGGTVSQIIYSVFCLGGDAGA